VRALIAALPVLVEPAPPYRPRPRTVLAPVWQPWADPDGDSS
jgi:hypothetical protein